MNEQSVIIISASNSVNERRVLAEPALSLIRTSCILLALYFALTSLTLESYAQSSGGGRSDNTDPSWTPNNSWDQPKRYAVIDFKEKVPVAINKKGVVVGVDWKWTNGKFTNYPNGTDIIAFNNNANFITGGVTYDYYQGEYPSQLINGEFGGLACVGGTFSDLGFDAGAFSLNNNDMIGGEGQWVGIAHLESMWNGGGADVYPHSLLGDSGYDLYGTMVNQAISDYNYSSLHENITADEVGRIYRISDNNTPLIRLIVSFDYTNTTDPYGKGYEVAYYKGTTQTAMFSGAPLAPCNLFPTGFIPNDINYKDEMAGTDRSTGHISLQGPLGNYDLGQNYNFGFDEAIRINNAKTPVTNSDNTVTQVDTPQVLTAGTISNLDLSTNTYKTDHLDDLVPTGWSNVDAVDINDGGCIVGTAIYKPQGPTDTTSAGGHGVLLVPAELMVDANHDGQMSFTDITVHDADQTTIGHPYVFWTNDDDDSGGFENATSGKHDYDSPTIKSKRDLEDFTRLWISFKGITDLVKSNDVTVQLTWLPKDASGWQATDGSPEIRVFKSCDEQSGGIEYITSDAIAGQQSSGGFEQQLGTGLVGVGQPLTLPLTGYLDSLSEGNPYKHLLFEGVNPGNGRLVVQLMQKGQIIGQFQGAFLQIKDIKNMYECVYPSPVGNFSYPYVNGYAQPSSFGFAQYNLQVQPEVDEAHHCIVYVSGWTVPSDQPQNVRNAESVFKRLWWQGYRGRFAAFLWYSMARSSGLYPLFNEGEFRGWKYGSSLASYVADLQQRLPQNDLNLVAHSLGVVPAASALKHNATVANCVFVLGSLPAGCFDVSSTVNSYSLFADPDLADTPDSFADLGYRGYLFINNAGNSIRTSITGSVTNLYNPLDFALVTGASYGIIPTNWEFNQSTFKPESSAGYYYDSSAEAGQKIVCYTQTSGTRYVSDPEESMPFVARSRSQALGAQGNVGGLINQDVGIGAGTPYDVGSTVQEHSVLTTRPIQTIIQLYRELLQDLNLPAVLSEPDGSQ